MVVSFFLSMYYNVINAWAFWYLFHSFQVCGRPAECLSPMEGPGGVVSVLDILQSHHQPGGGHKLQKPSWVFSGGKKRETAVCPGALQHLLLTTKCGSRPVPPCIACMWLSSHSGLLPGVGWVCPKAGERISPRGEGRPQGTGLVPKERVEDKLQGRWAS